MVDFNKHLKQDKPLSQKTEPHPVSAVPLPPGCTEDTILGNEHIANIGIGEALTGIIIEVKKVQTALMVSPNNLITFHDEAYGRVKFWSSGALNNLLLNAPNIIGQRITIQRIEDEDFKKGRGRNWRIFVHNE
jgi:hypothetical protein